MANERSGVDFILKIDVDGVPTYTEMGGLRTKSLSFNGDGIDVTNHGSNLWREFIDGGGVNSMSVSGSGVVNDSSTLTVARTKFLARTLTRFQLLDGNGDTYTGFFKITALEYSGAHDAEQTWSISLESHGVITVA